MVIKVVGCTDRRHISFFSDSGSAYARTLAVFNEAVSQLAVVVDNLEQLHAEKEAASSAGPPMAPANKQTQDKVQAAATGKQQQDAHQ